MSNNGIVNIHGKDYMTVAKRLELAHKDGLDSISTEVLQHSPVVVVKAIVTVKGKTFTGISSANPAKAIEKSNPYEVAETSAVGRALGMANYGLIESVASADEMIKATTEQKQEVDEDGYVREPVAQTDDVKVCSQHDEPIPMNKGTSKSTGKEYWYHRDEVEGICFGSGWKS